MTSIIFFGSFQDYSVQILESLHHSSHQLLQVVTTPPRPGNRGQITKTAVQEYCEENSLPFYTPENLEIIPSDLPRPDFIVVAGYGYLIPSTWLNFPKIMAINIHPSLLPNYKGRFPVEWAILRDEKVTGTTIIQMSEKFDQGAILAQQTLPIDPEDTRETLYTKLYHLSADLLLEILPKIVSKKIIPQPQISSGFYARQITRSDGYIENLSNTDMLQKMLRALTPWPGVWTYVTDKNKNKLTMKILSITEKDKKTQLEKVQIEGKKPTFWSEISSHYSLIS